MTASGTGILDTPIEGLLATSASRLPYQRNVLLRSYVLERPQGNLIVYNSPGVNQSANAIAALGAPTRLLINHSHESMYGQPDFGVPIWIHGNDRSDVEGSLEVAGTFDARGALDSDLEVIPTPGHTPGTTCYLWDNGEHRFLFTGDFIWIENGEWKAVVLESALRKDYVNSLALVRDLDFDVLVPWGATEGNPPVGLVTSSSEKRERISGIIDRVKSGKNR
jgi:glyoxylase-like metal-dependent hydrolase (beta-lactamase superfamily II)